MVHYGMTKTAQLAVSRGLAELTKGTDITVNTLLPGPTSSDGIVDFLGGMAKENDMSETEMKEEFFNSVRPTSLLQRFASVDEVANMATFLCSPLSSATNGSAIRVDGGVIKSIY
jgi:NAD(P)-dependent dehydrogenase (short-subunit alcohol dehydrogenase family)